MAICGWDCATDAMLSALWAAVNLAFWPWVAASCAWHSGMDPVGASALMASVVAFPMLIKSLVRRPRPCPSGYLPVHPGDEPRYYGPDRWSFPSGHAFALAYLGLGAHPAVWAWCVAAAASRAIKGAHWWSDVFAGALLGAAMAVAIPPAAMSPAVPCALILVTRGAMALITR